MSYCVNCGVELDDSAKKCALCATPVINPNLIKSGEAEKPFSENLQIPKGIKKRFIAFIITVIMLIPNIVMFFLNVFFFRQGFWSLYVLSVGILLWVLFVFPLFTSRKLRPFLLWAFDTLAVTGFVYVVFKLHGENDRLIYNILCIAALVSVSVLILLLWLNRRKRHWTSIVVILLLEATLLSVLSGMLTAYFSGIYSFFVVGIVIAVCTFVMMLFFVYCNKSKHVRAWLNKVFYL